MADQIKKLSAGHTAEVLDGIMSEVEEARGEYDNLGERLDEMSSDTPTPSTAAPAMDGTAAAGTSTDYARADHVHPSDTSKQDTLTAAQLAAVNSGINSEKVEQIETNKNNILSLYNQGVKNIAKPNTISATSGITIVQNMGHYEISGTTGGSQYTAYLCTPTEDIIATEALYIPAAATRTNVSYLCHWKNTQDESRYSIIGTGLIVPQGCKIHAIYIQVAANTTFSLNADMMICKKAIYDADPSYQPYAMSNAEITAWILAHS